MSPLQHLAELDLCFKRLKHPNFPGAYIPKTKYSDKTANGLTKAVIRCLELHGHYVTRVQSQGQYNSQLQRWTYSTTKRGTADIHAVIKGQHVSIEIKVGRDRMSKAQKATAQQVEQAGGLYVVISNYDAFWDWFRQLINTEKGVLPDAPKP